MRDRKWCMNQQTQFRKSYSVKTNLKSSWINILLLLSILTGMISCGFGGRDGDAEDEEKAVSVLVMSATNGVLEKYMEIGGDLKAKDEVDIYPDVTGKISYFVKSEGDYVWAGQAIAYIDRFQVGADYSLSPVRAPVSGYVTSIKMDRGANVAMTLPIASVGDLTTIEIKINIPERKITDIELDQPLFFSVPAYPDKIFEGSITRKDFALDSLSRTLLVRAEVQNTNMELLSGMYADVSIFIDSVEDEIILPVSAVFEDDGQYYVYKVDEDDDTNYADLQKVEVLLSTSEMVAIESGVRRGDEVVIFGREYLEDGTMINPIRDQSLMQSSETATYYENDDEDVDFDVEEDDIEDTEETNEIEEEEDLDWWIKLLEEEEGQ